MFVIRKALIDDLPVLLKIYARARQFMKEQGNESQWGLPSPGKKLWPSEEALEANIASGTQYVLELHSEVGNECAVTDLKDRALAECALSTATVSISATFCYTHGHDPLYDTIYDGAWPDNDDYGVLHMMASAGTVRGVGQAVFAWTLEQCPTLRIDTHPNNKPMRALLEKSGFAYCGKVDMYSVQNDDVTRVCYIKKA